MTTFVSHKKARFNFDILEELEAGIELSGLEVKSIKKGQGSLIGAHVVVRGGEAFLVGATIPPYQINNTPKDYEPDRPRKLLLNKKELAHLAQTEEAKGLTAIPLSLYNKGRYIKLSIGVARGKKKHDKREDIKKRDTERDIARDLKHR